MPLIFSSREAISYLNDYSNQLTKFLKKSEIEDDIDFYPISRKINNPKNNYKECLLPVK